MSEQCQGKHSYSTERQAYVAARKSGFKEVVAYEQAGRWFITRSKPYPHKRDTLPKANGPKPYVVSAKTIRGRLEDAARSIAAQRRYIEKADRILAAQTAKAAEIQKKAEQDHAETLAYIHIETNRIMAGRK